MTHILVLTPSLSKVSLDYRDTWGALLLACARRDIKLSVNDVVDPGLLPHARNVLLAAALKSDATHVLWWDADVAFDVAGLFDLLERPEAMIVRPYPMKGWDFDQLREKLTEQVTSYDTSRHAFGPPVPSVETLKLWASRWSAQVLYSDGKPNWSTDGQVIEVQPNCGFGFVLHKGDALRVFITRSDFPWLRNEPLKDWHNRPYVPAFDLTPNEQHSLVGEDVSFCRLWRHNRQIWAAPDRLIRNGGRIGRFADHLRDVGIAVLT